MAKYGKRPVVKRHRLQETRRGRMIRKATLERRERKRQGRPVRKRKNMRATRKGR